MCIRDSYFTGSYPKEDSKKGIYKINLDETATPQFEQTTMPGAAVRLAVGPSGQPWVVNASGRIYLWVPTAGAAGEFLPDLGSRDPKHQLFIHGAQDITNGYDGRVVVAGWEQGHKGGGVYRLNDKGEWPSLNGFGRRVAIDTDGTPDNPGTVIVTNKNSGIFHYTDGAFRGPLANMAAQDIAVSPEGNVYFVGTARHKKDGFEVFRLIRPKNYDWRNTSSWSTEPLHGKTGATNIAAGPGGLLCITNEKHGAYFGYDPLFET